MLLVPRDEPAENRATRLPEALAAPDSHQGAAVVDLAGLAGGEPTGGNGDRPPRFTVPGVRVTVSVLAPSTLTSAVSR